MPVTDIIIRSLSGYVFVLPILALYFCCLGRAGKKQTLHHIVSVLIFCYYLIGILTMTGIGKWKPFSPRMVWVPFLSMISGPIDTVLNVILFLPLGFFLPLLYEKYHHIGKVAVTGLALSLSVELVQMFGMGSTDINDLITNTVGAILGYFAYHLLSRLMRKEWLEKFRAHAVHEGMEVLLFMTSSFVIMVTVQPMLIHSLFSLG